MKKTIIGISPIISAVILIAIVVTIATIVAPWALNIALNVSNRTGGDIDQRLICQNTDYDFDTNYGTYGINWNFTGSSDWLRARIVNTGTQKLYGFSFEIVLNTSEIRSYDVNSTSQKTQSNPMLPGEWALLDAVLTDDINNTLTEVKILNDACPSKSITQEV